MTTISFSCPSCSKTFSVGPEKAGMQGKCPQCQGAIQVPAPANQIVDDRWDDLPAPDAMPPVAGDGAANPYASPAVPPVASPMAGYGHHGQSGGKPGCPSCGSSNYSKVGFTFWGGIVGPWLLNHVRCNSCSTTFNSKTGTSNNTAIMIYVGVGLAIGFVFGLLGVVAAIAGG